MKAYRNFGLVLSANFETICYIGLAWYLGSYLNEHYPRDFDWSKYTYVFGLLLIIRSWYVVFRVLIQSQKNQDVDKEAPLNETKR